MTEFEIFVKTEAGAGVLRDVGRPIALFTRKTVPQAVQRVARPEAMGPDCQGCEGAPARRAVIRIQPSSWSLTDSARPGA